MDRQAEAIRKGRAVLYLSFFDSPGRNSRANKNSNWTRAVVMRIHVAMVSSAPMSVIRQYFAFWLKSMVIKSQKERTTHNMTTSWFQAKPLA